MAKQPINYIVSFSPAKKQSWGGYTIALSLITAGVKQHPITATNFADLEKQVRALAAEYGKTCSPFVRLAERGARKPAGFDAWLDTMHIIEMEAAQ